MDELLNKQDNEAKELLKHDKHTASRAHGTRQVRSAV